MICLHSGSLIKRSVVFAHPCSMEELALQVRSTHFEDEIMRGRFAVQMTEGKFYILESGSYDQANLPSFYSADLPVHFFGFSAIEPDFVLL